MLKTVGFIGLGQMGKWMALNLVKHHFDLTVYDIDTRAMEFLEQQGATPARSAGQLAQNVDMIVLSLPSADVVSNVVYGDDGIMRRAQSGQILLDCGNSGFLWTVELVKKLIITVALTGNVPTKDMNPNLPVTADEIAADVRRCADAGAVLFHVHARDADQKPTLDIAAFKERAWKIKAVAPEVIVQLSTGGRAGKDWEDRATPIRLLPEMASFTTGANNLPGMIYENSPQFIDFLASVFKETGVKPARFFH
jgi:hypothetical protein